MVIWSRQEAARWQLLLNAFFISLLYFVQESRFKLRLRFNIWRRKKHRKAFFDLFFPRIFFYICARCAKRLGNEIHLNSQKGNFFMHWKVFSFILIMIYVWMFDIFGYFRDYDRTWRIARTFFFKLKLKFHASQFYQNVINLLTYGGAKKIVKHANILRNIINLRVLCWKVLEICKVECFYFIHFQLIIISWLNFRFRIACKTLHKLREDKSKYLFSFQPSPASSLLHETAYPEFITQSYSTRQSSVTTHNTLHIKL